MFDVNNIPSAQGAWPALWMTGSNWPEQGEIDVIEGALSRCQVPTFRADLARRVEQVFTRPP